jgi:hypothetical protein
MEIIEFKATALNSISLEIILLRKVEGVVNAKKDYLLKKIFYFSSGFSPKNLNLIKKDLHN